MRCYKLMLYKAYFEKGYALTNYVKYFILLFGVLEAVKIQSVYKTLLFAFLYGIACFFIGWVWYNYGLITSELEVNNQFNLFVQEVRNSERFK